MATYQFNFLNGVTEKVGADSVEYDEAERMFRAVCDIEGIVLIAPAATVRSIRKNPPVSGEASVDLYLDDSKLRAAIDQALGQYDRKLRGALR